MDYLVAITHTSPLTLHFSFYNTPDGKETIYVPKLLEPIGYFIRLVIARANGEEVYKTYKPKVNLKLHPERPESYQPLSPGYTFGYVLIVEGLTPEPGKYTISLVYSNEEFRGFSEHRLGAMSYEALLTFQVDTFNLSKER